jgi:hypothetical protein
MRRLASPKCLWCSQQQCSPNHEGHDLMQNRNPGAEPRDQESRQPCNTPNNRRPTDPYSQQAGLEHCASNGGLSDVDRHSVPCESVPTPRLPPRIPLRIIMPPRRQKNRGFRIIRTNAISNPPSSWHKQNDLSVVQTLIRIRIAKGNKKAVALIGRPRERAGLFLWLGQGVFRCPTRHLGAICEIEFAENVGDVFFDGAFA